MHTRAWIDMARHIARNRHTAVHKLTSFLGACICVWVWVYVCVCVTHRSGLLQSELLMLHRVDLYTHTHTRTHTCTCACASLFFLLASHHTGSVQVCVCECVCVCNLTSSMVSSRVLLCDIERLQHMTPSATGPALFTR